MTRSMLITCVALTVALVAPVSAETVWLSSLDLSQTQQGWGGPRADRSVDNNPLTIGGEAFEKGLGTHSESLLFIALKGGTDRFTARVGVDGEVTNRGSVVFEVIADGETLFTSGVMRGGEPAKPVDVDLRGVKTLLLHVSDAGDGDTYDHANWAMAAFEVSGEAPVTIAAPGEEPIILTPKPAPAPRINGAKVFGVRPGNPFLFKIAATGDAPLRYEADNLPAGLTLDSATGIITGAVAQAGEYTAALRVSNELGTASRDLRIVVGEAIALTPPLGWNSWNCWAGAVDQEKVLGAARAMVASGLIDHGWTYVNIDDTWQAPRGGEFNAILNNPKFPDMKGLCDEIHGMGLKAGIYSTPWVKSYAGFPGGASNSADGAWNPQDNGHGQYGFEEADARQWAQWGFDYLKYDWNPNDVPHVSKMADALRASGRDVVYSLSNSAPYDLADQWKRLSQCWRTTGDIVDTWGSMSGIGFSQDGWGYYGGPGHWNDPDMLVVGRVGWGPNLHPTRLTPNEQYTHISLWSLLASPLLLGCDLERLDEFTLSLLTNDEVLEVNQDPLGKQARRVQVEGRTEVWSKFLEDGSRAVGLFNRGEQETTVTANWADLGIRGPQTVRDLWRQQDLGSFDGQFSASIPRHGVVLVRVIPQR